MAHALMLVSCVDLYPMQQRFGTKIVRFIQNILIRVETSDQTDMNTIIFVNTPKSKPDIAKRSKTAKTARETKCWPKVAGKLWKTSPPDPPKIPRNFRALAILHPRTSVWIAIRLQNDDGLAMDAWDIVGSLLTMKFKSLVWQIVHVASQVMILVVNVDKEVNTPIEWKVAAKLTQNPLLGLHHGRNPCYMVGSGVHRLHGEMRMGEPGPTHAVAACA